MTKRNRKVMDQVDVLQAHIEQAVEQFICQLDDDSQWEVYDYETDGSRTTQVYEVTEETPPDRSVILKRYSDGAEFVVHWAVQVSPRDRVEPKE